VRPAAGRKRESTCRLPPVATSLDHRREIARQRSECLRHAGTPGRATTLHPALPVRIVHQPYPRRQQGYNKTYCPTSNSSQAPLHANGHEAQRKQGGPLGGCLQPSSQKSRTPSAEQVFQIGLCGVVKDDLKLFASVGVRNYWENGRIACPATDREHREKEPGRDMEQEKLRRKLLT